MPDSGIQLFFRKNISTMRELIEKKQTLICFEFISVFNPMMYV
jgi:hypothetical protein